MRWEPDENLIPLDPEIERTLKRILRNKREASRMEQLPMGPMEENRDDDVGSTRGESIHPDAANMDNLLPPIRDYGHLSAVTLPLIRRPAIQANNFELKSITLQLLQGIQFHGLAHEDPNAHILNFLEVCDTVKYNGVSDDAIRLRLFPFSLKDKTKHWLLLEPPDSITSWDDLSNIFLARFFPPSKAAKLRIGISSFYQFEGEFLYEAWERLKNLLRKCPHHSFTKWMQVHHFYNGLSHPTRTLIEASAGGAIMRKNEVEAYQILENTALNECQWPVEIATPKKPAGVFDLDIFTNLSAQVSTLSKQLQASQKVGSQVSVHKVEESPPACEQCHGPHPTSQCLMMNAMGDLTIEQAQYLAKFPQNQNFNPYGKNYNPGWKNHPNFSWKNQNAGNPMEQAKPLQPPQEKKSSLDLKMEQLSDMHMSMMKSHYKFENETRTSLNNQAVQLRNLEVQMASLLSERQHENLLSTSEINPRREGKEHCKAITLRSGKTLEQSVEAQEEDENPVGDEKSIVEIVEDVERIVKKLV